MYPSKEGVSGVVNGNGGGGSGRKNHDGSGGEGGGNRASSDRRRQRAGEPCTNDVHSERGERGVDNI